MLTAAFAVTLVDAEEECQMGRLTRDLREGLAPCDKPRNESTYPRPMVACLGSARIGWLRGRSSALPAEREHTSLEGGLWPGIPMLPRPVRGRACRGGVVARPAKGTF